MKRGDDDDDDDNEDNDDDDDDDGGGGGGGDRASGMAGDRMNKRRPFSHTSAAAA